MNLQYVVYRTIEGSCKERDAEEERAYSQINFKFHDTLLILYKRIAHQFLDLRFIELIGSA